MSTDIVNKKNSGDQRFAEAVDITKTNTDNVDEKSRACGQRKIVETHVTCVNNKQADTADTVNVNASGHVDRLLDEVSTKLCTSTSGLSAQTGSASQPRVKKFSHPGFVYTQQSPTGNVSKPADTVSPPLTPRISRSPISTRRKKHSLPSGAVTLPIPILSLNPGPGGGGGSHPDNLDGDEVDVTKSLETAVRKMSRGSSPNNLMGVSPSSRPLDYLSGLSGLARGYEQYKESLTTLRPTTEFGEASSDDLSSEWESSAEAENHNNNNNHVIVRDQVAYNLALNNRRRKAQMGILPQNDNDGSKQVLNKSSSVEDEDSKKTTEAAKISASKSVTSKPKSLKRVSYKA